MYGLRNRYEYFYGTCVPTQTLRCLTADNCNTLLLCVMHILLPVLKVQAFQIRILCSCLWQCIMVTIKYFASVWCFNIQTCISVTFQASEYWFLFLLETCTEVCSCACAGVCGHMCTWGGLHKPAWEEGGEGQEFLGTGKLWVICTKHINLYLPVSVPKYSQMTHPRQF
jgi:hypothetical protein